MRSAQLREGLSGVDRAISAGIEDVYDIGILGIGKQMGVVPRPLAKTMVIVDQAPVLSAVVGAIESALVGFDQRVNAIRLGRHAQANPAQDSRGQTIAFNVLPCAATVGRPVNSSARAAADH